MSKLYPTRQGRFREENPNWKGGRSITSHGYVLIRVGKDHPLADVRGYAYEHRLEAWAAGLNIEGKHVHHEDENTQHNSIENLEALTIPEHRARHRKLDSNLKLPNEPNRTIECGCGCGTAFDLYDNFGRPRMFVSGHNPANPSNSPTANKLLALINSGIESTPELVRLSGLKASAVKSCLSRLKQKGQIQNESYGKWRMTNGV